MDLIHNHYVALRDRGIAVHRAHFAWNIRRRNHPFFRLSLGSKFLALASSLCKGRCWPRIEHASDVLSHSDLIAFKILPKLRGSCYVFPSVWSRDYHLEVGLNDRISIVSKFGRGSLFESNGGICCKYEIWTIGLDGFLNEVHLTPCKLI